MNGNSARKSIQPLEPIDIGGVEPKSSEMVSEEVVGYLNSINVNTALLNEDDPLYDEYTKFLADMGNSPIVITNEDIDVGESSSYFDELDLSGKNEEEEQMLKMGMDYFTQNRLWANGLFMSPIFPIMPQYASPVSDHNRRNIKVLGTQMEVVDLDFSYEPQIIAQQTSLTMTKMR